MKRLLWGESDQELCLGVGLGRKTCLLRSEPGLLEAWPVSGEGRQVAVEVPERPMGGPSVP